MRLTRSAAAGLGALLALAPAAAGQRLTGALAVSVVEHRVDAGTGVEVSAGPLFTGGLQAAVGRRWMVGAEAMVGPLAADGDGPDRDLAQLRGNVGFRAAPWLIVAAGFGTRVYAAVIATQRWTGASLGADARLPFAGGRLAGTGRFAVHPGTAVTDLAGPNVGVTAAAGVEYSGGSATIAVSYWLERYDFPPAAGVVRHEQLAALMVRATWSPGAP